MCVSAHSIAHRTHTPFSPRRVGVPTLGWAGVVAVVSAASYKQAHTHTRTHAQSAPASHPERMKSIDVFWYGLLCIAALTGNRAAWANGNTVSPLRGGGRAARASTLCTPHPRGLCPVPSPVTIRALRRRWTVQFLGLFRCKIGFADDI